MEDNNKEQKPDKKDMNPTVKYILKGISIVIFIFIAIKIVIS